MKKYIIQATLGLFLVAITLTSCEKKLDLQPLNDVTSDVVYSTPTGYKQSLAKVYGSFALTGNKGPTGATDIVGLDEGSNADFYRTFWQAQQTSTDETVNGWGDNGVQDFHNMNWTSGNPFLKGLYFRSLYQITLANEFLRQSTDDKLSGRSIAGTDADEIRRNRAEVRFLRAFQYWVLMDMYGNPPFVTENDLIGGALPKQINRADLFKYVESELLAIEAELPAVKTAGNYGRVNKFAAQALLARIYLNAQIYTGTAKNTEAVTYAKKVIDGGFTLLPDYRHLLLADNNINNTEAILTINYDGVKTQLFGGTTFITHAAIGGNMSAPLYGVKEGWAGLRTTKSLVNLFPNADGSTDTRAQFFTDGQTLEINSLSTFKDGYAVTKYRNVTKAGASGSDATFTDIDVPLFRLAEMYLIYAEATLRGGAGDNGLALTYFNKLRERAYNGVTGNVTGINLNLILDERSRELYWEGHRRTDLVRYGRFTTDTYLWPWKGGVKSGKSVEAFKNLFPLPSADVTANPNLTQNTGY